MIHPKAHVDPDVVLGEGTIVRQFASVTGGTVLGRDCRVNPGAVLHGSIYGDRCVINMHVACGPGFLVGDDVHLGPGVCLANDMWPFASKEGFDVDALRSGDRFAVIIEDGAAIGAHAVVLPGVRIGKGAVVAAGAVVERNVPAGGVYQRNGYTSLCVPSAWREKRMRWAKETI